MSLKKPKLPTVHKTVKKTVKTVRKIGIKPDLVTEVSLGFLLSKTIIGVDEVGRGCLAGPVVAAAAILHAEAHALLNFTSDGNRPEVALPQERSHFAPILEVKDSKMVPEADRAAMSDAVKGFVLGYAIGEASVEEIESLNILYASHLAMERAVKTLEDRLGFKADHILVDGHIVPRVFLGRGIPLIKGDARSLSIACASIIAKVHRDELMQQLSEKYPGYGLKEHKGYSTPFHKKQILALGVTEIHRKSFRGVRSEENLDQASLFSAVDVD